MTHSSMVEEGRYSDASKGASGTADMSTVNFYENDTCKMSILYNVYMGGLELTGINRGGGDLIAYN